MRGRIKEKKMKTELKKIELNGKLLKAMKAEKYIFLSKLLQHELNHGLIKRS